MKSKNRDSILRFGRDNLTIVGPSICFSVRLRYLRVSLLNIFLDVYRAGFLR